MAFANLHYFFFFFFFFSKLETAAKYVPFGCWQNITMKTKTNTQKKTAAGKDRENCNFQHVFFCLCSSLSIPLFSSPILSGHHKKDQKGHKLAACASGGLYFSYYLRETAFSISPPPSPRILGGGGENMGMLLHW
jgi:hypothetical protein